MAKHSKIKGELSRPRETTVRKLFALSMNRCAFPGCETPLVDDGAKTILGEVCHICADSPGGPRYDRAQTPSERHSFDNLIMMCAVHHKVIDDGTYLDVYTVDYLRVLKRQHEGQAVRSELRLPQLTARAVKELLRTATSYQTGSVHMDFRQAVFRIGGEGGALGGGGGGGGVLTIVGTTKTPEASELLLDGGTGLAPGGGGGGAGAVMHMGRPVVDEDLERGLRVSSLFPVNAVHLTGLFHVLGGGWGYLEVAEIPCELTINIVAVVELGTVAADTLLRFEMSARTPSGLNLGTVAHDVAVPNGPDLTLRSPVSGKLQFTARETGVWIMRITSAGRLLGEYPLELRHASA